MKIEFASAPGRYEIRLAENPLVIESDTLPVAIPGKSLTLFCLTKSEDIDALFRKCKEEKEEGVSVFSLSRKWTVIKGEIEKESSDSEEDLDQIIDEILFTPETLEFDLEEEEIPFAFRKLLKQTNLSPSDVFECLELFKPHLKGVLKDEKVFTLLYEVLGNTFYIDPQSDWGWKSINLLYQNEDLRRYAYLFILPVLECWDLNAPLPNKAIFREGTFTEALWQFLDYENSMLRDSLFIHLIPAFCQKMKPIEVFSEFDYFYTFRDEEECLAEIFSYFNENDKGFPFQVVQYYKEKPGDLKAHLTAMLKLLPPYREKVQEGAPFEWVVRYALTEFEGICPDIGEIGSSLWMRFAVSVYFEQIESLEKLYELYRQALGSLQSENIVFELSMMLYEKIQKLENDDEPFAKIFLELDLKKPDRDFALFLLLSVPKEGIGNGIFRTDLIPFLAKAEEYPHLRDVFASSEIFQVLCSEEKVFHELYKEPLFELIEQIENSGFFVHVMSSLFPMLEREEDLEKVRPLTERFGCRELADAFFAIYEGSGSPEDAFFLEGLAKLYGVESLRDILREKGVLEATLQNGELLASNLFYSFVEPNKLDEWVLLFESKESSFNFLWEVYRFKEKRNPSGDGKELFEALFDAFPVPILERLYLLCEEEVRGIQSLIEERPKRLNKKQIYRALKNHVRDKESLLTLLPFLYELKEVRPIFLQAMHRLLEKHPVAIKWVGWFQKKQALDTHAALIKEILSTLNLAQIKKVLKGDLSCRFKPLFFFGPKRLFQEVLEIEPQYHEPLFNQIALNCTLDQFKALFLNLSKCWVQQSGDAADEEEITRIFNSEFYMELLSNDTFSVEEGFVTLSELAQKKQFWLQMFHQRWAWSNLSTALPELVTPDRGVRAIYEFLEDLPPSRDGSLSPFIVKKIQTLEGSYWKLKDETCFKAITKYLEGPESLNSFIRAGIDSPLPEFKKRAELSAKLYLDQLRSDTLDELWEKSRQLFYESKKVKGLSKGILDKIGELKLESLQRNELANLVHLLRKIKAPEKIYQKVRGALENTIQAPEQHRFEMEVSQHPLSRVLSAQVAQVHMRCLTSFLESWGLDFESEELPDEPFTLLNILFNRLGDQGRALADNYGDFKNADLSAYEKELDMLMRPFNRSENDPRKFEEFFS